MVEPPAFLFGAVGQTLGAPLCFLNADQCASRSESVVNFRRADSGPWSSQFASTLPMVAVAATATYGGPVSGHAAVGSCLELELVSLAGPAGGRLNFWEAGDTQPRLILPVGEVAGTNRFCLSESQGAPGVDPYGLIQGRRFSLTQSGLYCLGLRVVDASTNGPGAGAIHASSELYQVYLQAGLTVTLLTPQGPSVSASFGGEPGRTYCLERAPALGPAAAWQTVAGPLVGASRLQTLTDSAAAGAQSFYRLRATVP